jgi:hypothetical protein
MKVKIAVASFVLFLFAGTAGLATAQDTTSGKKESQCVNSV